MGLSGKELRLTASGRRAVPDFEGILTRWGLPGVRLRSSLGRDTLLARQHGLVILTGVSLSTP